MDIATTVASSTEQRRFATVMVICNGIPRSIRSMHGELELQGSRRESRQNIPRVGLALKMHRWIIRLSLSSWMVEETRGRESASPAILKIPFIFHFALASLKGAQVAGRPRKQPTSMPRKSEGARAPSRRVDNFAFVARDAMSAGVVHRHVRGLQ